MKKLYSYFFFVFFVLSTISNAQNKLVQFRAYNSGTSSFPISQSASNLNTSLVSSASIDYSRTGGISTFNDGRSWWQITNSSPTLDASTAPYLEYTLNFNSSVNLDFDRFVISGGASNSATKFELRWSVDNYTSSLGLFTIGSDWAYRRTSVNLNSLANFVGSQLKFRLYFYNTSPSGSHFLHSETGPYSSLDSTPQVPYDIWSVITSIWYNPPPPTISSFTPSSGAIGSSVVITGTDFTGATAVKFNGTNATSFTVNSATQITATVPSGSTTGTIEITTSAGSGTSTSSYTVIPPPTISSFTPSSAGVGSSVVITGTDFTAATAVKFNGTNATSFTVNSATQITATVPSGATTGTISVTTSGGIATSSSSFTVLPPSIQLTGTVSAFTKCSGSPSAAQTFSVSGSNLTANLVIVAYANLEYSLDGITFSNTFLSLTTTSGTVAPTTVYVRMTSSSTTLITGNVNITSTGATSRTISVSGTVNTLTTISAYSSNFGTSQTVCQGTALTALSVTASGTGLTYQWYSNTTASTTGSTLITGATSASYTPVNTTPSVLYYYCVVTGTCGTVTSNISALRTVNATSAAGTVSATTTTVCAGDTTTLNLTGSTGTVQWQSSSTINGTYVNIVGATSASYTTPGWSINYRAQVTSGNCPTVTSSVITINYINSATSISTYSSNFGTAQTVCQGNVFNPLSVTASGTGLTYQWYSNTAASTTGSTLITGATNASYTPTNTTPSALYYYCVVTGTCGTVTSNISALRTVNAIPVAGTITGVNSICSGATTTLTLSGNVGTVQWQKLESPIWSDIAGATNTIFTTPTLTQNTSYRAVVASSSCSTANTASFNVSVNSIPAISGLNSVETNTTITLTATTSPANSNAWISSNTAVATISNSGVVTGISPGSTTITYTNASGCTATQTITVVTGTTQPPVLNYPAANTTGATTLNINYSLPEIPLAGSVRLTFTPTAGGAPIVWTMTNTTSVSFSHVVGTNPLTVNPNNVVAGGTLSFTTYNLTLSYQDANGNPVAQVTNANIQTLAPPSISFASSTQTAVVNRAISLATINSGGAATFTIVPALPTGVVLNSSTGLISGTPTAIMASLSYTITATNAAGSGSATFTLFIDSDLDGDGIGDATDPDTDGDGVPNTVEIQEGTSPTNPNDYKDTDGDGVPDYIESQQGTNPNNPSDRRDTDGDGVPDYVEIRQGTNPNLPNNPVVDTDGDGIIDSIDTDDDGDTILDINDAFPLDKNEWKDSDKDGRGDNADTDDDNDGILDVCDVDVNGDRIPDNGTDIDRDGIIDSCDPDRDGDGVNNTTDNCPDLPNTDQADRDRDGLGNVCDTIVLNAAQTFTPNGDGINDTWVVYNLENHPGSIVRVFNSNGKQVFYSANYKNDWNGNYQGSSEMLPIGSYLYQIDLDGDGSIDEQAWLYITK